MSTYIPRFSKHPTDDVRYQQLIRERMVKVGRLTHWLETHHLHRKGCPNTQYRILLDEYRLTMRLIEAMEHDSNFTDLSKPIDNYLNLQP